MKPQVGAFVQNLGLIRTGARILGRHHQFGRFFADFFQDRVVALAEQARHIRFLRIAAIGRLA
ncbi:hypothetical protein D3C81_2011220 [compost metagenome]